MVYDSLMYSCRDTWVSRHAKIVIRAPNSDVLFSPGELLGSREGLCFSVHLLEDSVRMVLLLFLNLTLKECLICKWWC